MVCHVTRVTTFADLKTRWEVVHAIHECFHVLLNKELSGDCSASAILNRSCFVLVDPLSGLSFAQTSISGVRLLHK